MKKKKESSPKREGKRGILEKRGKEAELRMWRASSTPRPRPSHPQEILRQMWKWNQTGRCWKILGNLVPTVAGFQERCGSWGFSFLSHVKGCSSIPWRCWKKAAGRNEKQARRRDKMKIKIEDEVEGGFQYVIMSSGLFPLPLRLQCLAFIFFISDLDQPFLPFKNFILAYISVPSEIAYH